MKKSLVPDRKLWKKIAEEEGAARFAEAERRVLNKRSLPKLAVKKTD